MANNNNGQIKLGLDIPKTVNQINSDIKKLQDQLKQIKTNGALDITSTVREINAQITALQSQLKKINIEANVDTNNATIDTENINTDKLNTDIQKLIDNLNSFAAQNEGFSEFKTEINGAEVNLDSLISKLSDVNNTADLSAICSQANDLKSEFMQLSEVDRIQPPINNDTNDDSEITSVTNAARAANEELETTDSRLENINDAAEQTNELEKSWFDTIKSGVQDYLPWSNMDDVISGITEKFKMALEELKEVDTYLAEISKSNSELSKSDLRRIASNSFLIASKYGKKSIDYLSSIQEISLAGYKDAEGIAELSMAAQNAGDMTADLSNQIITATDEAYKMNGSVTELTKVLDGMNYIADHNTINMTELSDGMAAVSSTAAAFNVKVDETTAALSTMIAATQQSGSETARAFKAILLNIRQVSDEEEGIDAEGLAKYESACNALNVKLRETKNGISSLRNPMEVLKELSIEYNKLDENDTRRTNLLSSVGDKSIASQLDALLRQWDTYETMLQQYKDGTGSMAAEAEKTANSWEGSLNRLSNTWTSTVNNVTNSDAIIAAINAFNGLLSVADKATSILGPLGSIGLGAGIFSLFKSGKSKERFCPIWW